MTMRPLITAALAAITLTTLSTFAQDSVEDQVAEYLRRFPYQLTYDYTVRFTGGDPRNLNRWIGTGEPALVRAGEDVVPRTNNDTYYKAAALFLEDGPVIIESNAPSVERFNSIQLIDDRVAIEIGATAGRWRCKSLQEQIAVPREREQLEQRIGSRHQHLLEVAEDRAADVKKFHLAQRRNQETVV